MRRLPIWLEMTKSARQKLFSAELDRNACFDSWKGWDNELATTLCCVFRTYWGSWRRTGPREKFDEIEVLENSVHSAAQKARLEERVAQGEAQRSEESIAPLMSDGVVAEREI